MRKSVLFFIFLFSLEFCFAQKPLRIITAGSAMTETVCALGLCDQVIAADRTSLYPPKIQTLPSIGYRSTINAEGIIGLNPTYLVAEKDYVEAAVLQQVKSAGILTVVITRNYSVEGTNALIRQLAKEFSKQDEGETLIAKIDTQLKEAEVIAERSKNVPKVLCIYNRGTSAVDLAGTKTFSEILPYVGAVSAITGVEGYKPLNAEALIISNPEFILMFESGLQSIGGIDGVLRVPGVLQTNAGKNKRIIAMEGIKLSNFGPRFGEAVIELAITLHGETESN
jgi:iron complex transport system substrate-binding protein